VRPWLRRIILAAVIAMSALVVASCMGLTWPVEVLWKVLFGWIGYLIDDLPRVRIDRGRLVSAAVYVGLFAVGLHWFCRWLFREVRSARGPGANVWRKRWTGMVLLLVLLMFATGTAAVGIVHQVAFLRAKPMYAMPDFYRFEDFNSRQLRGLVDSLKPTNAEEFRKFTADDLPIHPGRRLYRTRFHDALEFTVVRDRAGQTYAFVVAHRDPNQREHAGVGVATERQVVVERSKPLEEVLTSLHATAATQPSTLPTPGESVR